MERLFRKVTVKWCYITTDEGTANVRVIEDSGSANNWISNVQRKRFRLVTKIGRRITDITLTGEEFSSSEYVDVPWVGKSSYRGIERFYIAPEKMPIEMLVGVEFMEKHPGALMDQEPTPQLLTLQSKVQVGTFALAPKGHVLSIDNNHLTRTMSNDKLTLKGREWRNCRPCWRAEVAQTNQSLCRQRHQRLPLSMTMRPRNCSSGCCYSETFNTCGRNCCIAAGPAA